jgi:hypothetical protein
MTERQLIVPRMAHGDKIWFVGNKETAALRFSPEDTYFHHPISTERVAVWVELSKGCTPSEGKVCEGAASIRQYHEGQGVDHPYANQGCFPQRIITVQSDSKTNGPARRIAVAHLSSWQSPISQHVIQASRVQNQQTLHAPHAPGIFGWDAVK